MRPDPNPALIKARELQSRLREVGGPRSLVELVGFVGPSPDGCVRLFGDLTTHSYAEVEEGDILHYEQDEGTGLTWIYVSAESPLSVVDVARDTAVALKAKSSNGSDADPVEACIQSKMKQCINDSMILNGRTREQAEAICEQTRWLIEILCRNRPRGGIIIA